MLSGRPASSLGQARPGEGTENPWRRRPGCIEIKYRERWQWAAGSGCDAAPYFRIFNPTSQMEKFDKQNEYIKKWVPEFNTAKYSEPIVEHTFARNRCLEKYKEALLKK